MAMTILASRREMPDQYQVRMTLLIRKESEDCEIQGEWWQHGIIVQIVLLSIPVKSTSCGSDVPN